jgi:ribonuclease E
MLVDGTHPEETRIVVSNGNKLEEFDFESQSRRQLRGNIYLAKVTRVEPSLQAAFIEYGGNRHGFLAFSEIHPDYYQIPVADREALMRAVEEEEAEDDEHEETKPRRRSARSRREPSVSEPAAGDGAEATEQDPSAPTEAAAEADPQSVDLEQVAHGDEPAEGPRDAEAAEAGSVADEDSSDEDGASHIEEAPASNEPVESLGGTADVLEENRERRQRQPRRHAYKIQEVIKRRQVMLVQVVKEERGNKGAALTTYLSLAGRYSVLMPNTARGGGISRKITNAVDRKRLKEVVADLEVPQGMGVILRTAGESRTKAEIKRDYEYLMRLWENVRSLTLQSTAPALVYEEGSLIKRSVRDLYNKDIDEIQVAGDDGYREAKDFMRMLMPSHAKVVQPYRETTPLFARFGVEAQLDRMLQPQVTLKSGGYIIINQTEALVSIDVNSGRSTKEHSIEETALHTNLEAAEEVARQLRLRDLAGLIVIDFIDMEENRNNRAVEKRLKDHLKNDRARIQLGRISHFGLMEMSRQRIRASVLESTMKPCPHCGGTGHVRSDSSVALLVVRAIEEFLLKDSRHHIVVKTPASTALYVLNHKRSTLHELEARFGLTITIEVDETVGAQHYSILRGAVAEKPVGFQEQQFLAPPPVEEEEDEIVVDAEAEEDAAAEQRPQQQQPRHAEGGEEGHRDRKRRRRRRRRGGRDRDHDHDRNGPREGTDASPEATPEAQFAASESDIEVEADMEAAEDAVAETAEASEDGHAKKRRRGKRGGKRNRRDGIEGAEGAEPEAGGLPDEDEPVAPAEVMVEEIVEASAADEAVEPEAAAEPAKKPRRSRAKKAVAAETVSQAPDEPAAAAAEPEPVQPEASRPGPAASPEPAAEGASRRKPASSEPAVVVVSSTPPDGQSEPASDQPKRGGWWQRKSFF